MCMASSRCLVAVEMSLEGARWGITLCVHGKGYSGTLDAVSYCQLKNLWMVKDHQLYTQGYIYRHEVLLHQYFRVVIFLIPQSFLHYSWCCTCDIIGQYKYIYTYKTN